MLTVHTIGLGAYEELIHMTRHEPSLRGTFNEVPYQILLKSCQTMLQKISQARINSIYFSIYDGDCKLFKRSGIYSLVDTSNNLVFSCASNNSSATFFATRRSRFCDFLLLRFGGCLQNQKQGAQFSSIRALVTKITVQRNVDSIQ